MYIRIKDSVIEYPYFISTLKKENPNTSFPDNIEMDFASLAEYGVYKVYESARPYANPLTHKVVETLPVEQDGRWVQDWAIVELNPLELNESLESIKRSIIDSVQQRLDTFARTREYDGIMSLCTYATSSVPKFSSEGQYGVDVRDATWIKLYEILDEINSGIRPIPSGYSDIEDELPTLSWPSI